MAFHAAFNIISVLLKQWFTFAFVSLAVRSQSWRSEMPYPKTAPRNHSASCMGHLVLNIFASSLIRRDNKKNFVQACALAKVCVCVWGGVNVYP